jgi:hypothetical protein
MSVFSLQERIPSPPSNEVIPRISFHRLEKEQRLKGTRPVHLHCLWSLVLISDSFYVQRRDEAIKDEAWRFVCLIIRRRYSCHRELAAIHSR